MKRIYLDNNATTPVREEVKNAVLPFLMENYGNASSRYKEGRIVKNAVESSREVIAKAIGTEAKNLVFTSCATEGNNTVLRGYGVNFKENKNHIIVSAVEHPAVLETAKYLTKHGYEVSIVPVDQKGRINPADVEALIKENTGLVSIMLANNEIGNIYPVKEIAEIAHKHNVLVHTDAVQAVGKIPVDFNDLGVDFMTISGHKFYALKGIGALVIRKGKRLTPYLTGGHQEKNRRAGTENVIGIISMGAALELALKEMDSEAKRVSVIRDYLEEKVVAEIPYVKVLGDKEHRLPTTTNISFEFVEGEGIQLKLDYAGIAVSTGSACSSGTLDPSHVITAMHVGEDEAHSTIRFSLGRETVKEDIDYTVEELKKTIVTLRSFSPLYDRFINNIK